MSKSLPLSALAAAAALAIGFSFTPVAPAQAASLLNKCMGTSKAVVMKCCTAWVKRNGKPQWMIETGATCSSSVACSAGKGKPAVAGIANVPSKQQVCQLEIAPTSNGSSPTPPPPPKPNVVGKP